MTESRYYYVVALGWCLIGNTSDPGFVKTAAYVFSAGSMIAALIEQVKAMTAKMKNPVERTTPPGDT